MLYFYIDKSGEEMAVPRDTRVDCVWGFVSPKSELPRYNWEEDKETIVTGIPVRWYDVENDVYYID
jgi:hypothetical protein